MTPRRFRKLFFYTSLALFVASMVLIIIFNNNDWGVPSLMIAWALALMAVDQRQIKY